MSQPGVGKQSVPICKVRPQPSKRMFTHPTFNMRFTKPTTWQGFMFAVALVVPAWSGYGANPVYPAVVKGDGALAYYRFNDPLTRTLINANIGSLGAAANASNDLATVFGGKGYSMPGAIVGDGDRAAFYDYTTRTEIPFNSALNTPNTQPFTVEAWLYPVSDQGNPGMGALCNRWTQGGNRQGWVMYQRGANTNSGALTSGPGLGWEFRCYNDLDTSTHLDVQSQVPFTLGKWQHVVIVYDPVGGDPLAATLTIYIDGVFANAVTNVSGVPGYGPCTGDHATAPNGQPAMSLGGYNNANSGTAGFANPWTGGVDEFAWYPASLSAAQILSHYQNGTNANRSQSYSSLILSHNPAAYLRLNELAPGPDVSFNVGDGRSAGHATNSTALKHPGNSALAGRTDDGSVTGKPQGSTPTGNAFADIPWNAANNPDASVPFTIEAWFRPKNDQTAPGPCPINNRLAHGLNQPDVANRTGWVIYQRDPNATYQAGSGETAIGWTLRLYRGNGGSGDDVVTSGPYNVGEWQHVVFTWDPTRTGGGMDNGPTPSLSEQWQGTLIAYTNGVVANSNTVARYAANVSPTETGIPPADLAIGMYNIASQGGGIEEFYGDVDEFAFYSGYMLTPEQVLAHYQAGTNSHPAVPYETLVFNAAGDAYLDQNPGSLIPEGTTIPKTYLRFNEAPNLPAANSGSLGYLADGSLVLTTNTAGGPISAGFESPNPDAPLDGLQTWVSLNNPSALTLPGQITLEAWINPAASQGATARVFSHGPPTHTFFDPNMFAFDLSGTLLSSNEVFLRIEGSGATYSVGTSDGNTVSGATAAVTAGDLGGGNGWIHLAGTYDGANWRLYRNGVQIASAASGTGALAVNGAEWAIGSTGNGWGDFFTGGIDEVAIYGTALNAATIKAHYYVGQNGPVTLAITPAPANTVNVTWPAGTLQQASAINGTFTDVLVSGSPATSPYNTGTAGAKFYRVKL